MLRVPMFALLGLRTFTRGGYERASKNFQTSRMDSPNALDGRTVMVTGASPGGIGYQIALEAARRGATVHVVCRSENKGRQAVDSIRSATQNANVVLKVCDLASLQSIKTLAREYTDGERPEDLHVLVNNAGLMVHGGERSADGFELNFAVNTLGTYVLTRMLEPALQRCAPSRVVVVSSGGALTEHLEVDDLEMERRKGGVDGTVQYARDKRRQLAIVEQLAERWRRVEGRNRIGAYAMHPGWTETEGVKRSLPGFYDSMKDKFRTLEQGADTAVWLACEDESKLQSGALYLDRRVQTKHLPLSFTKYSQAAAQRLIQRLDEMGKLTLASS